MKNCVYGLFLSNDIDNLRRGIQNHISNKIQLLVIKSSLLKSNQIVWTIYSRIFDCLINISKITNNKLLGKF